MTVSTSLFFSPIKYENDSGFIEKDFSTSTTNGFSRQPLYIQKMDAANLMDVSSNSSSCSPRESTPTIPTTTILPPLSNGTGSGGGVQKFAVASSSSSTSSSPQKLKHPTNLPYDPLIHTNNKPPLSFSSLIFLAIEDSIEKALPVKEIYAWIVAHYPYFKTAPTGWKNSVRHNLSLNKSFQKVEKAPVITTVNKLWASKLN